MCYRTFFPRLTPERNYCGKSMLAADGKVTAFVLFFPSGLNILRILNTAAAGTAFRGGLSSQLSEARVRSDLHQPISKGDSPLHKLRSLCTFPFLMLAFSAHTLNAIPPLQAPYVGASSSVPRLIRFSS